MQCHCQHCTHHDVCILALGCSLLSCMCRQCQQDTPSLTQLDTHNMTLCLSCCSYNLCYDPGQHRALHPWNTKLCKSITSLSWRFKAVCHVHRPLWVCTWSTLCCTMLTKLAPHCGLLSALESYGCKLCFPQTFSEYDPVCALLLTAYSKTCKEKIEIPTFPLSPLIMIGGNLIQASQLKQSNGGSVGFAVAGDFSAVWSISCFNHSASLAMNSCVTSVCKLSMLRSLTIRALSLLHINACGVRNIADWANG